MDNLVFLYFVAGIIQVCMCLTITWIDGFVSGTNPGYTIQYILYEEKQTWNEAKSVCQSLGGDLAKVDSQNVRDVIVSTAFNTYNEDIFTHDYWVGLTEISEGQHQWTSDCSGLTWPNNYLDNWDNDEKCFKLDKKSHVGERKECDEDNSFLCQKFINQTCTMEVPTPIYSYNTSNSNNETACRLSCQSGINCVGSVYLANNTCMNILMNMNGTLFNLSVKNCVILIWDQSNVSPQSDNNKTPNVNCDSVPSPTSTTSTTTISTTTTSTTINTSTTSPTTSITTPCTCSTTTTCPAVTSTCPQPTTYFVNLTHEEILEIAREISKNLTVDAKSTSAYFRKLNSAEDNRSSSTAVGFLGLLLVVVPLSVLVLSDLVSVIYYFKQNIQEILSSWRRSVIPEVIWVDVAEPGDVFGKHYYA